MEILTKNKLEITWDSKAKECVSKYQDASNGNPTYLAYPCLKFIQTRLELLNEFQVGAFVWEGGQGLEYFYGLL